MENLPDHLRAEKWLRHMFASKAVQDGGVVRRKVRDVERLAGRDAFEREIRRRGFRAVENGGQFVVFCNNEDVRVIE